jgi:hypothetical protein
MVLCLIREKEFKDGHKGSLAGTGLLMKKRVKVYTGDGTVGRHKNESLPQRSQDLNPVLGS